MRKLFSSQLIEARHEMLSIFESIDLTLHDAVTAFVTDDMELARRAKKKTYKIDARCANLEAVCYNLIATQSPVASDFRLLQTIIYIDFNLQRMSDKVRRIARAAKRKVNNDIEFPAEMVALIEQEAASVYQVLGSTVAALVNNDLAAVLALSEEDEAVHGAYQEFFRVFNRTETMEVADDARWTTSVVPSWSRATWTASPTSPWNPPIASCSCSPVSVGGADDIADADEEELESMRIPSGEA